MDTKADSCLALLFAGQKRAGQFLDPIEKQHGLDLRRQVTVHVGLSDALQQIGLAGKRLIRFTQPVAQQLDTAGNRCVPVPCADRTPRSGPDRWRGS